MPALLDKTDVFDLLKEKSRRIRELSIRTVHHAQVGHVGGPLSMAEIMASLYFDILNIRPEEPAWINRDRFILSKGHSSAAYYATLAERGFFPIEKLKEFDQLNGMLQGHPDMIKTPGVDMSTGSLGQGLSAGIGMCLGRDLNKQDFYTYILQGDGETQEGQVWEAAMYAGFNKTRKLILIIDCNQLQQTGFTREILDIDPLADKFQSFRWKVLECDGNDIEVLHPTILNAKELSEDGPVVILARTLKGHGLSFTAGQVAWHSSPVTNELFELSMNELGASNDVWN